MKNFALTRAFTVAAALLASGPVLAQPSEPESFRARDVEDEVIYFVLPDRFANGDTANDLGGYPNDRLVSGYDPTHKGFYHGGDLKGLTEKLDYIQGMGVTAIWFAPIFKNKPVQGTCSYCAVGRTEGGGIHRFRFIMATALSPTPMAHSPHCVPVNSSRRLSRRPTIHCKIEFG